MLKRLARLPPLRSVALPALRVLGSRDLTIRHHWWPGYRVRLNGYRHRGYWFKGRDREHRAMEAFRKFVKSGDTVIEIGGHIGYVSLHLRGLIGDEGRLIIFEPGPNNLPYLRANIAPFSNIELVEAACGDDDTTVDFWIEGLSGQNNSLDRNYKNFEANRKNAFSVENMRRVQVPMKRLDSFLDETGFWPDIIKIDVEGAEQLVLEGAERCLAEIRPTIVMEVTENADEVTAILQRHRYRITAGSSPEWICVPLHG